MKDDRKIKARVGTVIFYACIALLAALTVYLLVCRMSGKVPFVLGRAFIHIVSPSMEDTIPSDSYIIIKKTDVSELKEGDVITFYSSDPNIYGKLNTHRIEEINTDGSFTTKGDANRLPDNEHALPEKVVGKYIRNLKLLSVVMKVISSPYFILSATVLLASLLVVTKALGAKKKSDES